MLPIKSVLPPKNVGSCLVASVSDYFVLKTGLHVTCRVQCCFDAPFGVIFRESIRLFTCDLICFNNKVFFIKAKAIKNVNFRTEI